MSHAVVTTSPRRARVLLVAYACAPGMGSEPGIGWNRAVQTARYCDTWVICEGCWCEPHIARHLREHGPVPGLHFAYVRKTALERLLTRVPGLYYLAYHLWHRRAAAVSRKLHAEMGFDLVHQVNLCGYREPGYLWQLDAPFIWGPVGGTQNVPWRFLPALGLVAAIAEGLRTVMNILQLRFSRRVRHAARRATVLLTANSTNQADFTRVHGARPVLLLETGLPTAPVARGGIRRAGPLQLLWAGDHKPFKGLPLLLHALASLPADLRVELRVVGSGRATRRWQRLARRLGLADRVRWLGRLPHREALEQYASADAFVFTSLRDTSGNVVLEALNAGTPVICLDHQGARDIVTPDCGVKLPVQTPGQVIRDLATAIRRLATHSAELARLSDGAIRRAGEYFWPRQAEKMAAVYRRVLKQAAQLEQERAERAISRAVQTRARSLQRRSRPVDSFHRVPGPPLGSASRTQCH